MTCLRPKQILNPSKQHMLKGQRRNFDEDYVVVPCGKCINCLKSRQDNFACRIRCEAEKKGTLSFLTLTYRDDSLPLVSTMWRCYKDTGECERITKPGFVCYSRKDDFYGYRDEMRVIKPSRHPRYIDIPFPIEDENYSYFYRITPSCCRKDVQLWFKTYRNVLKKRGISKDFSYAVCSEMGAHTCRPHYHVCIFGLSPEDVEDLARLWIYGYVDVKHVNRVNPDGTDGFSRVADYVGKYVAKGDFECDSVKCGAALGTRMMTSKNLGSQIVEKFKPYCLAYDMVGAPYDIDSFYIPSKNRYLNRQELVLLSSEIPKRLSITFDGMRYFAFPRVFRNKIFYVEKKDSVLASTYRRPSRLWKMVVDAIREQYQDIHRREFESLLSNQPPRKVAEAVASFNEMYESSARLADDIGKQTYERKLNQSNF